MEYSNYSKYGNEPVDGFILQAPVSDREGFAMFMAEDQVEESLEVARALIDAGKAQTIMPADKIPVIFRKTPFSAYRWHSLISVG
jgi:hypothetical protein